MQPTTQLILIAIAVGLPIGALVLPTEWEKKARRLPQPWLPFGHRSIPAILSGMLLVKVPLGFALFLGTPYFALEYFDLIPMRGENLRVFFMAYLLSLGCGKLARYGYWRWTFRGQLV